MTTRIIWLSFLGPTFLAASLLVAGMNLFVPWDPLWRIEWLASFFLGILVTFLCQKEFMEPHLKKKKEDQQRIEDLEERLLAIVPSTQKETVIVLEKPLVQEDIQKICEEMDIKYRELRKQFEEKSQVLSQTRKELFLVENQLLSFQREQEERIFEENPLEKKLLYYFREIQSLEEEVESLEKMISELFSKKRSSPSRKRKPKKEETIDLFL